VTGPLQPVGGDAWRQPARMACPVCDYSPDALGHHEHNPADPRAPETGDYSICFRCGEVSVIEIHPLLGASLREPTLPELAEFSSDPANVAAVKRLHRFNAQRRGDPGDPGVHPRG
jgi:hypothetical protein